MQSRAAVGKRAEDQVAWHLEAEGYRILGRNVRVGRLEVDIIAQRGSLIVFCEVRARMTDAWLSPADSVDYGKRSRIRRAALQWLQTTDGGSSYAVRFDVAAVVFDVPEGRIEYYEDAF